MRAQPIAVRGRRKLLQPRRGMAVLLVLGLLAITLALSYASLRGQGMTAQLARNATRALDAREAARSGLSAALRKISEDGWAGVDVPLTGNVTGDSWFEVTFTTGDPKLLAANPTNPGPEYAFHLTIDSTGFAADPADPTIQAVYKSRCVVRLVRRALQPAPANWSTLTGFTVYQWGNRNVLVQEPVRIAGRASVLGRIWLSAEYPLTTASRDTYLSHLNSMRLAGRGDHRPFESPLTIALARQDVATLDLLTAKLGLTTVDSLASTTAPLAHPGAVLTYRLYPGGAEYTPPVLQEMFGTSTLQEVPAGTLAPDPVTNPLGVFRSSGPLSLQSNVHLRGTLISDGSSPEVQIYGTNVVLEAADLPLLSGDSQRYQLPAALIRDDLRINNPSGTRIAGFAGVWDEFEIKRGSPTTQFEFRGSLLTNGLSLRGRDTWAMTSTDWGNDLKDYNDAVSNEGGGLLSALIQALVNILNDIRAALGLGSNDPVYFPEWEQHQRGFTIRPALTFAPGSSEVRPHWHDWSQPIYVKGPSDAGLRWELVRWEDGL